MVSIATDEHRFSQRRLAAVTVGVGAFAWMFVTGGHARATADVDQRRFARYAAADPDILDRLEKPTTVSWSGTTVRRALGGLAAANGILLLCDRRVDPDASVDEEYTDVPVGHILESLARTQEADLSVVGALVYIGPLETAHRMRTQLASAADSCSESAMRDRLWKRAPTHWSDFAEPQHLLAQLAEETGVSIEGLERIPHDLWAAAELPSLPSIDRMNLVAAQFDLQVVFNQRSSHLTICPIESPMRIEVHYEADSIVWRRRSSWRQLAPDAKFSELGDTVVVLGTVEEHERLLAGRRARPSRMTDTSRARHTLRVTDAPRRKILEAIVRRFDLVVESDGESGIPSSVAFEERITLELRDATVEDILTQLFADTKYRFALDAKRLRIWREGR